jgi:hypothetical protein
MAAGVENISKPRVTGKGLLGSQVMGKAAQFMYDRMSSNSTMIHHCIISKMSIHLVVKKVSEPVSVHSFTSSTTALFESYTLGSKRDQRDTLSLYTDEDAIGFSRVTVSRSGFVQFTGRHEYSKKLFRRLKEGISSVITQRPLS